MPKLALLTTVLCILFLQSCIFIKPAPTPKPDPNANLSGSALASSYIGRYKKIAQDEMKRAGVPASIKLAQAILESGYGRSELAKNANNHFGIKCGSDWKGKTYHLKNKNACFRAYSSADESFRQHSDFLKGRSHYASLFKLKPTDYKGWARGLQKAGYATDSSYPSKLIELIERYKLYEYDK